MRRAAMWLAAAGFAALMWVTPAHAQVNSDGIYGRYNTYFETMYRRGRERAKRIREHHRESRASRHLRDARREFDQVRRRAVRAYQRDIQQAAHKYSKHLREVRRSRGW
jgi:hypothetical protein